MALKHLDQIILEDLRDVMEDEYATLIETYVNDSIARLQSIKGAVESGVADKIRETAHTLKGSSSNIGAVHLSELCKKLEDMGRNDQTEGAEVLYDAIVAERLLVEKLLNESLVGSP